VSKTKVGIKFVNEKFTTISKQYDEFYESYQQKQKEIQGKLTELLSTYVPLFEESSELISEIDILCTFANVALNSSIPFVRPEMKPKDVGDIILKKSRHPCLEVIDSIEVIANDIELKRNDKTFVILTGCNMGGKSTFIKQIAINVLMSQIGSFVPCEE
jgi:DNA mismatch repair protein MSH2